MLAVLSYGCASRCDLGPLATIHSHVLTSTYCFSDYGSELMSSIDYSEKIPNNVNLSEDRTLQRALEQWQPNYLHWWQDMGPDNSTGYDVYLRTAVSVDPSGWAQFGYVKMP